VAITRKDWTRTISNFRCCRKEGKGKALVYMGIYLMGLACDTEKEALMNNSGFLVPVVAAVVARREVMRVEHHFDDRC